MNEMSALYKYYSTESNSYESLSIRNPSKHDVVQYDARRYKPIYGKRKDIRKRVSFSDIDTIYEIDISSALIVKK
jgi:hypothetical protein